VIFLALALFVSLPCGLKNEEVLDARTDAVRIYHNLTQVEDQMTKFLKKVGGLNEKCKGRELVLYNRISISHRLLLDATVEFHKTLRDFEEYRMVILYDEMSQRMK